MVLAILATLAGTQVVYAACGNPPSRTVERRLTRVDGPRGTVAAYEYDAQHNLIAEGDARGARTAYQYDVLGRPIARVDALGRETRVGYDAMGRRTSLALPDGTGRDFGYDGAGRLAHVTNGAGETTRMTYTGIAALARVELPDGRVYRLLHNPQEKLIGIENPLGEAHRYKRDDAGRVVVEDTFDGRTLRYDYAAGRLAKIHYPDGGARRFEYAPTGQVTLEATPDLRIEYARDKLGRLIATKAEGYKEIIQTKFERDADGRIVADEQQGRKISYARDVEGRVVERLLPNGARTKYRYDNAGALESLNHDGFVLDLARDAVGRETGRRAGTGVAVEHRYDAADRLIERQVAAPEPGAVPGGVGGRRATGVRRTYEYDRAGRVTQIDDARWGATVYQYDATGRLLESRQRGLVEAFAHDAADSIVGWLTTLDGGGAGGAGAAGAEAAAAGGGARTIEDKGVVATGNVLIRRGNTGYKYDRRNRRTAKIVANPDGSQRVTEYDWDGRDRLRKIKLPDGTLLEYSYDAFGRRVHRKRVAAPMFVGGVGGEAGAPGESAEGGDAEVTEKHFLWDGEVLAAEFDPETGPRVFVHEPGSFEPVLQQQRGEVFLSVNDHLGMPKDLVSGDGLVVWSAQHAAYGKVVAVDADQAARDRYGTAWGGGAGAGGGGGSGTGGIASDGPRGSATPISSPFRLLGQVADEEAELCWTRFRCFDPETGRWLTPDPAGVDGGLNLVGFDGAPTRMIDPLGLAGSPHLTFRGDSRKPAQIFAEGFSPRGDSTDLRAHARDNRNPPSNFISTSTSPSVARENFASPGDYVYVTRPRNGVDVNKELGDKSPFKTEKEIAVPGGIAGSDIMGAREVGPDGKFVGPFIKIPTTCHERSPIR